MLQNNLFNLVVLALLICFSFQCKLISNNTGGNSNLFKPFKTLELSKINYPIRFTYINTVTHWWPPQTTVSRLGVPGFAKNTNYNYIALAFWLYPSGPTDTVLIWSEPIKYFGQKNPFGRTKDEVQKYLKKKYNEAGIKILVSAFGATQQPTRENFKPIDCAQKLGLFVKENNLDGVDVDWEDTYAMERGIGEQWLITFQTRLRELLPPPYLITHAPQAPYFKQNRYPKGAYLTVDKQVGHTIDFYNVQFYNQETTRYDTYSTLFKNSGGFFPDTSVIQISKKGVPLNKIVVGKPATKADAFNTGFVPSQQLGEWTILAYTEYNWYAGVMFWQYSNDLEGKAISNAVGNLKQICDRNKNCI